MATLVPALRPFVDFATTELREWVERCGIAGIDLRRVCTGFRDQLGIRREDDFGFRDRVRFGSGFRFARCVDGRLGLERCPIAASAACARPSCAGFDEGSMVNALAK